MTTNKETHWSRQGPAVACLILFLVAAILYFVLRSSGSMLPNVQAQNSIHISQSQEEMHRHKILLVHSYHRSYPWVDTITHGVHMALEGQNIQLEAFYMDTKRYTTEAWKRQSGNTAKDIVAQWQPHVIVAADDNAQRYFAQDYANQSWPPIVFCGVNAALSAYGYPASNITGILERPHFEENLRMVSQLLPQANRVAIITDDSPTSAGAIEHIKDTPAPWCIALCEQPVTFQQWKSAVEKAQNQADVIAVYMYHTIKRSGSEVSVEPTEVMAWTVQNSRLPIIGFFDFAVDDGALCGYMESGMEHGLEAGRMVGKILAGQRPSEIPVITALKGQAMVNLDTANRLTIDIPEGFVNDNILVVGK